MLAHSCPECTSPFTFVFPCFAVKLNLSSRLPSQYQNTIDGYLTFLKTKICCIVDVEEKIIGNRVVKTFDLSVSIRFIYFSQLVSSDILINIFMNDILPWEQCLLLFYVLFSSSK